MDLRPEKRARRNELACRECELSADTTSLGARLDLQGDPLPAGQSRADDHHTV